MPDQDEKLIQAVDAALIRVDKVYVWCRIWLGFWFNGWRLRWAFAYLKGVRSLSPSNLSTAFRWSLWCYLMGDVDPRQSGLAYANNMKSIAMQNGD